MRLRGTLVPAFAIALGVAGCDEPSRDVSEPEPREITQPVAVETPASIIRPEVMAEQAKPPLEPLEATVPFGEGGFELSDEAVRALGEVLSSDQLDEGWAIVLRGHTDSVGHDEANLRASRRRAEAVAEWLVENGVEEARITVIALGEQRPVAPNALPDGSPDEEGRARNRRVTITIAPAVAETPEDLPMERTSAPDG